jgi:magnesium and cobalt exporter, CNNM family
MSVIASEILIILGLLLVNGVFAMSELALVSARKVRLERRAEEGDAGARAALDLASRPTEFLSAVQVGITLIGVLSGAFGGATIAEQLALRFARVPALASYSEALGLGVVVAGISYLSLVIGELVPKRIALTRPEVIAALVARPVGIVARIFRPLVALLTASTNLVLRLAGVKATAVATVSEEEIRALVEEAAETGVVQPAEQEIVESAFRLGDRTVAGIMTPRPDVDWIDITDAPDAIRARLAEAKEPRWVICRGTLDRVLGILHTEDLLAKAISGAPIEIPGDLHSALRQPLYVPDSMPVYRLLDHFRTSRQQVAIVLDEFGGVEGLVTLDHILEALVGEYAAQQAGEEPLVIPRDDGSWLVDGSLPVDELEARLGLDALPMEERRGFRTVAGFIFTRLGRVPEPGESVEWAGLHFEIIDMDGRRIEKVVVRPARTGTVPDQQRDIATERDHGV